MARHLITALVASGGDEFARLGKITAPQRRPDEALIRVQAVSVNRGELHRLQDASPGWRPGWDFAGTVEEAPESAAGIAPATQVFGIALSGSWAEQVTVPVRQLAPIPGGMTLECAAALPVAGLTAFRLLHHHPLDGRSVLVTGAAGGVGRMLVQLARRAGALVTAVVGSPERVGTVPGLGAQATVFDMARLRQEFHLILDSVGGDSLRESLRLVLPGGTVRSFGNSSRSETTFNVSEFYLKQARLLGFNLLKSIVSYPPSDDLARLGRLCTTGQLRVDVASVLDWRDAGQVLRALRDRRLAGKAVLRLPDPGTTSRRAGS